MAPLPTDLRKMLEKRVVEARKEAEAAARALLATYAFAQTDAFPAMWQEERGLRTALRQQARAHGGGIGETARVAGTDELVEEIAYEAWHRMLFSRFLAENDLLMHPGGAPLTLEDCAELAAEERQREGSDVDAWDLAARYASAMLPGIFSETGPAARAAARLAPEGRRALESIVTALPAAVFTADDSLGWVYQFWQSNKKDEVNASGRKIGGADIAPVTQLFTEHYMVRFLLENSLGAWWAARHPESPLLAEFEYLRFRDDPSTGSGQVRPAAGTFPGWPEHAAEVTVMDPCCGSGHFLVETFDMLTKMRMEEEGIDERSAGDAVLRDNLHGLEIDERCTEIAAFALAFTAWKRGGYRKIPMPNIACSGIAVSGQLPDWERLGSAHERLRITLNRLYHLFKNAPTLGSLIDPRTVFERERLLTVPYDEVEPLVETALARERAADPAASVFGGTVVAAARAASLLARQYVLVGTNVPYLKRGGQDELLRNYCEGHYEDSRADLATSFIDRCARFVHRNGTYAVVAPQNWLFLSSYERFRRRLLSEQTWDFLARMGAGAFETISGEVVNVALFVLSNDHPHDGSSLSGVDVSSKSHARDKAVALREAELTTVSQQAQLSNPDSRVSLAELRPEGHQLLSSIANYGKGSVTGDRFHYLRHICEVPAVVHGYARWLNSPSTNSPWSGRDNIVIWNLPGHEVRNERGYREHGQRVWRQKGVAIAKISDLPVLLYDGELFDDNLVVLNPHSEHDLPMLWAYCNSDEFRRGMRSLDSKLGITAGTFVKISLDVEYWRRLAENQHPGGLPEPYSNDLTQWLFKGRPEDATEPLQVAVARLLGYRWPEQESDDLDRLADVDGIVTLPAIGGERPAAERLRALLATADWGEKWSQAVEARLLAEVGFANRTLEDWLRDGFFEQHVKLFQNRPFIWQIWDGRKDGFSVLVNYHTLDSQKLDRLIYTTLGRWIEGQRAQRDAGDLGAEARLSAARVLESKLKAIGEGEDPYDIYVRWKPLHEQSSGWEPDLNDGVRLNIRPWIEPFGKPSNSPLRAKVNVKWGTDRGTNPDGSARDNSLHFSLADKRAAREGVSADG